MSVQQPVLFVSHGGGPSFFMDSKSFKGLDKDSKAADFLRNLTKHANIRTPKAILVLSAHWEEKICTVGTAFKPSLYYDYGGFPPEMYKLQWPVPGAPELAFKVKQILKNKGIQCNENNTRGLDHGVFVPLKLAFPEANVPVLQVSLLNNLKISDHLAIAEALSDLPKEGVLIIGSGFATHNTRAAGIPGTSTPQWALDFQNWLHDILLNPNYTPETRKNKILNCTSEPGVSKLVSMAHPRLDHFIPLLMSSAAAQYVPAKNLYSEFVMQTLLNEHYYFPTD